MTDLTTFRPFTVLLHATTLCPLTADKALNVIRDSPLQPIPDQFQFPKRPIFGDPSTYGTIGSSESCWFGKLLEYNAAERNGYRRDSLFCLAICTA